MTVNDEKLTLQRGIDQGRSRRPMSIYWGSFDESVEAPVSQWKEFPFNSYPNKESFSDVLFEAMGIPSVEGDLDSQITMHQILRLMYVDQLTPYDKVFVDEDFDQQTTRQAVGDLLCGIADSGLYRVQIELEEKKNKLSSIRTKIDNLKNVIADISDDVSIDQLRQRLDQRRDRKEKLYREVEELIEENEGSNIDDNEEDRIDVVRENIRGLNKTISSLKDRLEKIRYSITDSNEFIKSLKKRKRAIEDASSIRDELGVIEFSICPSCYSKVEYIEDDEICNLCGSKFSENGEVKGNKLKIKRDIENQIKEYVEIQDERIEKKEGIEERLESLYNEKSVLQDEYNRLVDSVSTTKDSKISEYYEGIGYIKREIEDIAEKIEVFRNLNDLQDRRDELLSDVEDLEDTKDMLESRRDERRTTAFRDIRRLTGQFLRWDLPREEEFENPEEISFDFGEDEVRVNGRSNYAASSMVYLKNAFHLAIFSASCDNDYFRYPRFGIFDNIEDKGMEEVRSHNLQSNIIRSSVDRDVMNQIILTTSMINPDLDNSDFFVGPYYTRDNKTLDL